MNLSNQHKALLLTLLIMGTVVLSVFNFSLIKQKERIAESYYEIEPEPELTEEEIKVLEALGNQNNAKAETNQAYNETQQNKHFAQAFKPIAPPEDYEPQVNHSDHKGFIDSYKSKHKSTNPAKLKNEDINSFSKVNDLLKKQQNDGANTRSTMSYSLVNRKHYYLPTPVYLCENGGKIVVNITVNSNGDVIDAYVNTSSTSSNECLVEHALQYAENAKFSKDASKDEQIGSITFNFIGKH
ncbi:energy transducer TonB [Hyunsoonleella aquatilis]|uniref:energy transducer TonB n=1 Tax=Hyunsoonleella aquatilis TaxID=2762758 RepID=UPI001FE555A7|nr:energy transducer TonB [Hyunsoonleella aquatilis]